MKYLSLILILGFTIVFLSFGCKAGSDAKISYPENFDSLSDSAKVDFLIENLPIDSLAPLVINAVLIEEVNTSQSPFHINSLNETVNYIYLTVNDSCKKVFGEKLNSYSESLPDKEKFRLYYLASSSDPHRLGFKMGKEFAKEIQNGTLTPELVARKLKTFQSATEDHPKYYPKFLKGFKIGFDSEGLNFNDIENKLVNS